MSSPPVFLRFFSTFSRIDDMGAPRQLSPCTTKSGFNEDMTASYMMASCTMTRSTSGSASKSAMRSASETTGKRL